jgi:hypothetical protein
MQQYISKIDLLDCGVCIHHGTMYEDIVHPKFKYDLYTTLDNGYLIDEFKLIITICI